MSQPNPVTLDQIAPELRESIRKMPRTPVSSRLGRWLLRTAVKFVMREQQYDGISIETHRLKAGGSVRVYTPAVRQIDAGLLWIHGGGLVIGSVMQDDAFCATTALELGIIVVSAEYRLAPDFPFPAALDDCWAAWNWLQDAAPQLKVNPAKVAVGGQSAGGGLAASLVQRLHDLNGIQPAIQWLFCPMLDDRTAATSELDAIQHFVWNNRQNRTGWQAYLGSEFNAPQVAVYAVPARRVNLQGLPPAWIGVGDIDLFFAEDQTYAGRLLAAGVDCTLDIVVGAPHGFEVIVPNTKLTQDYLSRARTWLRHRLINL